MKAEQKKRDRWWVADMVYEIGSIALEVALFIPKLIARILKDS